MLNPKVLIENNLFYKPGGILTDTAIRISRNEHSNFKGTTVIGNATTSKYLYSENLGSEITNNVSSTNNSLPVDIPFVNPHNHDYNIISDNCLTIGYLFNQALNTDVKKYNPDYIVKNYVGAIEIQ